MIKHRLIGFSAAFGIAVALFSAPASAAYISSFNKTTNDGVFTLSAAQATYLGVPTADSLGFFRVRDGNGQIISAGDTFDATSILNSTNDDAKILGIFNGIGTPTQITYTGSNWDSLGTTTIIDTSVYRGVAFAFNSSSGNIVFNGTATYNAGQTLGPSPSPVPLPAAVWLFGSGLLGLVGMARRKKA